MTEPRRITVAEIGDVQALEARVRAAATSAARALTALLARDEPLAVLHALKFRRIGFQPLHPERAHNLLEQVHQTFAYLAAVRGLEHLLRGHPEHAPIPHGTGQTILRELLLVADHNAYHVGQLIAVRRLLGIWTS